MIHLLPYLEEQINSEKAPEDIYMVLKSVTDSRKAVLFTNEEFIGQVYPLGFRIFPKVNGRNSFRPILTGNMTKNGGIIPRMPDHMAEVSVILGIVSFHIQNNVAI